MSKSFCSFCSELETQRTSTISYHPQGNAMVERKNQTIKEYLSNNKGQYQHEWIKFLPLEMMAYESSIHSVTKYKPAYVVLGFPLLLPINCFYSTTQNAIYATQSGCFSHRNKNYRKRISCCKNF